MEKLAWVTSHPEYKAHPLRVPMRVLRWEWHRMLGRPVVLPLDGLVIQARPSDGVGRMICYFREGADELFPFMKAYLKRGMTFVDVGANIGSHTIYGARLVGPTGKVLSFEADPATFALLQNNLKLNGIENAVLYSQCISDQEGTVTFNVSTNSARSSLLRKGNSQRILQASTLDNLLKTETHIDLLKIDVEGADYLVLSGARRLFETIPPSVVVVEVSSRQKEISDFLLSYGYQLYRFDHGDLTLTEVRSPVFNTFAIRNSSSNEFTAFDFRPC